MRRPSLTLVAAVASNGAIGQDNGLLWSEPEDQKHFRRVTLGRPVIMGRRTWDSLPSRFRPLPDRRNFVVTRDAGWHADGAEAVSSLDAAMRLLADEAEACVIGGAQIYALAMPYASQLLLTEIDVDLDGDTFFPDFDRRRFTVTEREPHIAPSGVGYSFVTYTRINGD